MSILVIGGAGFIGRRLIPLLVADNQAVTCMDIDMASATAAFSKFGDKVKVVRGDVTAFDDVIGAIIESKAERVANLSYFIGELEPHVAFKLDIQGMDNCFEAARRTGVKHTVFASSVAVSGQQAKFGERLVNEDDPRHGDSQYAVNKTINEWQAHDYRRKYGMTITCVRPANVTGPDKKFGSIDHVNCMCQPASILPSSFSIGLSEISIADLRLLPELRGGRRVFPQAGFLESRQVRGLQRRLPDLCRTGWRQDPRLYQVCRRD